MAMAAPMRKLLMQSRLLGNALPTVVPLSVGFHIGPICCRKTKHWNPKFKKERREKVIKVELPDYDKLRKEQNMSPEEMRAKLKEKGIAPSRPWMERPIIISSTAGIFEAYVPPEGDGKLSSVSITGAKQKLEWLQKKGKSVMALRKIRNFEEDFDVALFSEKAHEIYVGAHSALAEKDEDKLHEFVTETCFPEVMMNIQRKTMKWQFIKSLELPRVCHVRCTEVISKENVFAQVTMRFHSQQTLAVYDRFGRLIHGSEVVAKDVLEYVVFEKHLANQYGLWRIHGKITPDWMPSTEPLALTYVKKTFDEPPPEIQNAAPPAPESKQPPLAVA